MAEGNYFASSPNPVLSNSGTVGNLWFITSATDSLCTTYLGRSCKPNVMDSASTGTMASQSASAAAAAVNAIGVKTWGYTPVAAAPLTLSTINYGVGNLA